MLQGLAKTGAACSQEPHLQLLPSLLKLAAASASLHLCTQPQLADGLVAVYLHQMGLASLVWCYWTSLACNCSGCIQMCWVGLSALPATQHGSKEKLNRAWQNKAHCPAQHTSVQHGCPYISGQQQACYSWLSQHHATCTWTAHKPI